MMGRFKAVASQVFGLFVDDAGFAAAIAGWLVVAALARTVLSSGWTGGMLFAGLAVILLESVVRRSRN